MTDEPSQNNDSSNKAELRQTAPKLQVTSRELLLSEGAGRRLAGMRKKFQVPATATPDPRLLFSDQKIIPDLPKHVEDQLEQARKAIDDKIIQITDRYPAGKKYKMFTLRFGPIENIPTMSIKQAFQLLGINSKSITIARIADLDYCGNNTKTGQPQ